MNLRFTLLYKDGHLTRAFQKEKTWHCTSIAKTKRICEQKLESSLIQYLSEKIDEFDSVSYSVTVQDDRLKWANVELSRVEGLTTKIRLKKSWC